jgi:hypothetical protein
MASNVTLLSLRTSARQRADMVNSQFVTDSEVNGYVNASLQELHDLLISAFGNDYQTKSVTFATQQGVDTYPLASSPISAADFYKLLGLDQQVGSLWFNLQPFSFRERNRFQYGLYTYNYWGRYYRYKVIGSSLVLAPMPTAAVTLRLWYAPVCPVLAADGDTYDDVDGFSEYVVVDAAIKCLLKEESDVSAHMARKQELLQRIQTMAENRDAGEPMTIGDIYDLGPLDKIWR